MMKRSTYDPQISQIFTYVGAAPRGRPDEKSRKEKDPFADFYGLKTKTINPQISQINSD